MKSKCGTFTYKTVVCNKSLWNSCVDSGQVTCSGWVIAIFHVLHESHHATII